MSSYCGKSTDVVGYAWRTENWCPRDVLEALGFATTGPVRPSEVLESEIRLWCEENGVDPQTTEAPQPIFNSEEAYDNDGKPRTCCTCHEPLIDNDITEGEGA